MKMKKIIMLFPCIVLLTIDLVGCASTPIRPEPEEGVIFHKRYDIVQDAAVKTLMDSDFLIIKSQKFYIEGFKSGSSQKKLSQKEKIFKALELKLNQHPELWRDMPWRTRPLGSPGTLTGYIFGTSPKMMDWSLKDIGEAGTLTGVLSGETLVGESVGIWLESLDPNKTKVLVSEKGKNIFTDMKKTLDN